jgi:hypothetical protein
MRRIAAVILLCIFGAFLPSATVFALAAPDQSLPVCCRIHGAHHCLLAGLGAGVAGLSQPAFRAPGCLYRQGMHAVASNLITFAGNGSAKCISLMASGFRVFAEVNSFPTFHFDSSAPRAPPAGLL